MERKFPTGIRRGKYNRAEPDQTYLFRFRRYLSAPDRWHWIPHHRFDEILAKHDVDELQWENIGNGIAEGQEYLSENHHLTIEDQERAQFQSFHNILLKGLGAPQPNHSLTHKLARVIVDENNIEPFANTQVVIPRPHKISLHLGILGIAGQEVPLVGSEGLLRSLHNVSTPRCTLTQQTV